MNKYYTTIINEEQDFKNMCKLFSSHLPDVGGFDTETTGLHIIKAKPFVFAFGWINKSNKEIHAYSVDMITNWELSKRVINFWQTVAEHLKIYYAHNVKFDLHMMTNIGMPYEGTNLSDTMFLIRLAHDAVQVNKGGPPLALKDYTKRYIDRNGGAAEDILKAEKSKISKQYNKKLYIELRKLDKEFRWTQQQLNDFLKKSTNDIDDLPSHIKQIYDYWFNNLPKALKNTLVNGVVSTGNIPYHMLNRVNLMKYACMDIVYMLEIHNTCMPVLINRGNQEALRIENSVIRPLYEMERVGFTIDLDYLNTCITKTKEYLKSRRAELNDKLNTPKESPISVGQHARIKQLILLNFDVELRSTNNDVLNETISEFEREHTNEDLIYTLRLIQELRTLEKWYSTYMLRFLKQVDQDNKIYTTINQVGTVSGRVTSDFQQFPKYGIKDKDGNVLFEPRRMIIISGEEYIDTYYLDYSQIELRIQALYTILLENPDLNLCRAYMPYKCHNKQGEAFNFNIPYMLKQCNSKEWFRDEDNILWHPTDLHGATTKLAFDITEDDPQYKKLRSIGKRVNFAKNYGAQFSCIRNMFPEYTNEQIAKINNAYYEAFPSVKLYHDYCYKIVKTQSNVQNLFGVRYYNVSGHNLINMLVQGSGAYFLKIKIREVYDYCKKNNIKTRFQMNIHDELSFERHKDESPEIFKKFKSIMETWDGCKVPIVADVEVSNTNWAEKKEVIL